MSFVNKQLLTYLITRRCAWRAAGRGRSSVFDGHSRLTPSRRRGDSNLASRVIKRRDNKGLTHSVLDERSDASETRPRNDPILCRVESSGGTSNVNSVNQQRGHATRPFAPSIPRRKSWSKSREVASLSACDCDTCPASVVL